MKKYLKEKVYYFAGVMELVLSTIIVIILGVFTLYLLRDIIMVDNYFVKPDALTIFLKNSLSIVIGIEFVKMLVRHTPGNVIEVLLFATSRMIILDHSSTMNTLIGIACIAALFATRKFLFSTFDDAERSVYRANYKSKLVNVLAHVHIPAQSGETLKDIILKQLEAQEEQPATGACAYFQGVVLRIEKMRGDEISQVEVIKTQS